jgi:hypothetical protein
LVEYFKQAVKLLYGLIKKEALKLALQYDNENATKSEKSSGGSMWLRGLRKSHESLCVRKPEATVHTRCTVLTVKM